jgi:ribonucleoside-diphosphate reductase alpha chain
MLSAIEQGPDAVKPDTAPDSPIAPFASYPDYKVVRRNGAVVGFDASKVSIAMTKAFLAVQRWPGCGVSARIRELVARVDGNWLSGHWCDVSSDRAASVHIEDIQDQVELALMRSGEHEVARAYVLVSGTSQSRSALQQKRVAGIVEPGGAQRS